MLKDDVYGLALILVAACILLIYFVIARPRRTWSTLRRRSFHPTPFRHEKASPSDLKDVGQQLSAVMGASFEKRRLLNRSEYQAFKIIETDIAAARRGYRVFAQTSLGEVLMSPDEDAFRSINAKRVDILIVDQSGWPVAAVEYQGNGHYQGTAAARDAVKKEALRKAGIRYVEITATDSAEQIRSRVREHLGWRVIGTAPCEVRRTA
jgi:hypothetical protein